MHKQNPLFITKGNNSTELTQFFSITNVYLVGTNVFAKCDEIPSLSVQDIEKTKRRRQTNGWTDNMKTVYPPPQTQFAGGIMSA